MTIRQEHAITAKLSRTLRCLLGLVLCMAGVWAFAADESFQFDTTPGKLPKSVVPHTYRLHLIPDVARQTFTGEESIDIEVREPVSQILLNALNLKVRQASIALRDGPLNLRVADDSEQQTLALYSSSTIAPGRYVLKITYDGIINREPQGLYVDRYQIGQDWHQLLGTQFEATDARRMFPCWDEPSYRAQFQLTVDLPTNYRAFSNTPIESDVKVAAGRQRVKFAMTPPMSSYLLVLAAGEFERLAKRVDGIEHGVVTTRGKVREAEFALDSSVRLLDFYNDYFGQTYPLTKLDHIAVPGGFEGAMENWGGILYNETNMLVAPGKTTENGKHEVFATVAHEMAHQWFGDLVTMGWWDNLWLNEGFATWMESKVTQKFHPEWNAEAAFRASYEQAMSRDAARNARAIYAPVKNESEANDAFDAITYQKGGAVLRMIENSVGEQVFRDGLRLYMKRHRLGNANNADLWAAMDEASGKSVSAMANSWVRQAGFPLVTVDSVCENSHRTLKLSQSRYMQEAGESSAQRWIIPIKITHLGTQAQTERQDLVLDQPTTEVDGGTCDKPVILDPEGVGYFRVQYAPAMYAELITQFSSLGEAARLRLVSDQWALASSGRVALADYLTLLDHVDNEQSIAVWDALAGHLTALDAMMNHDPARPQWRLAMLKRVRPAFERFDWVRHPAQSLDERRIGVALAALLDRLGDQDIGRVAQRALPAILSEKSRLAPDVQQVLMLVAARHADQRVYESLLHKARSAQTTSDAVRYFGALFSAEDPTLAQRSLQIALDKDVPLVVSSSALLVIAGTDNTDMAWRFAREHASELLGNVAVFTANRYLPEILRVSDDVRYADELQALVKNSLPSGVDEAARASEQIRYRAWRKAKLVPQLHAYLEHVDHKG